MSSCRLQLTGHRNRKVIRPELLINVVRIRAENANNNKRTTWADKVSHALLRGRGYSNRLSGICAPIWTHVGHKAIAAISNTIRFNTRTFFT